jgi:phosphate:Na+ symporter
MAAAFILGANIGTTIDAVLASIGTKTAAKRSALVHVLFNTIGTCWALPLLIPLLKLVDFITPGESMLEAAKTWTLGTPLGFSVTTHLAMLHTVFNSINTFLFLPFVKPFAQLVSFIIPDSKSKEDEETHYVFINYCRVLTDSPELNIFRVEKEIRDMAGIVSLMYARFSSLLQELHEISDKEKAATRFREEMKQKESYVDEMRETLTAFLIECTRRKLNPQSERRVTRLMRVISDIEEMSDECYGISCLLERSARKKRIFKSEEIDNLVPYVGLVEEFLVLLQEKLGQGLSIKSTILAKKLEVDIGKSRRKLQKLSRKRIEAGKDVQTELLFIDLVRRIERLGDYCGNITEKLFV